jgi:hypothetical protein
LLKNKLKNAPPEEHRKPLYDNINGVKLLDAIHFTKYFIAKDKKALSPVLIKTSELFISRNWKPKCLVMTSPEMMWRMNPMARM